MEEVKGGDYMGIIEDITEKITTLKTDLTQAEQLVKMAEMDWWVIIDPDFTHLRELVKAKADAIIAEAQALRAMIP